MRFRSFSMAAVLLFVMGCSLFDSGMPWESGPYALLWIDLPDEVQLSYDLGRGSWATLVGPRVFAVGANQEYVVAQQHPGGDKTITNFFIIEVQAGAKATSQHGIMGPLGQQEFYEKAATLRLPAFTKTLESLR